MSDTLHHWTEASLAALPRQRGVRLRGMAMTRLETFTDAAFAFAVTLLVISVDDIPGSYDEFVEALRQIPAFVACFLQLMVFWWGHHVWSRRYGLEDSVSMVISLTLVATMLVYIYPLRVMFGAFFANASGGRLPGAFALDMAQIGTLFAVFGVGFALLSGLTSGLFLTALRRRRLLCLNPREVMETWGDVVGWGIVSLTGIVSTILALVLPDDVSPAAGYVYWSLIVTMPAFGLWHDRRRRRGV